MTIDEIPTLKEYIRACTLLGEDLDQAICDLEFISHDCHEINYAVDFSELYEYILPSDAYLDFVLFPDAFEDSEEEKIGAKAIQQLILRYILLEMAPGRIILLPPYILEFSNFIHKFESNIFNEFIKSAHLLYKRFQGIASESLKDEILILCQKAMDGDISASELEKITGYIGDYGQFQSIVESIDSQNSSLQRLRRLDSRRSLMKLDSEMFEGPMDTSIYRRWVRKFDKLRPINSATSKIDAAAIQYLFSVNRLWKPNKKLILISRSKYMHNIYRHEIAHGHWNWDETGEYYLLRHPRVFSLVLPASSSDCSYNRDDLIKLREMVTRFLTDCGTYKQGDSLTLDVLQEEIRQIKEKWRMIQQYAITLGASEFTRVDATGKIARNAQFVMDVIRKNFYRNKLVEYLEKLLFELDNTNEFLRLSLQGLPEPFFGIETLDNQHGLTALSSKALFMPYKLYLESDLAVNKLETISSHRDITTRELITFLKENPETEDFEYYLLNAYVLGAQGWWHFAETYCRLALAKECPSDNLCNEGKYLLAVCISQQHGTSTNLLEALHLVQEIPYQAENPHHARYQIEYGLLSLKLNMKNPVVGQDIPTATSGLFILDTHQGEIKTNPSLWLTVLKTKLDYYCTIGDTIKIRNLQQEGDELEKTLIRIDSNSDNWPPSIVDAVAWVKWLLFSDEFTMQQEHQAILDLLQMALDKTPPDLELHHEIQFHIKEIQKKISPPPEK